MAQTTVHYFDSELIDDGGDYTYPLTAFVAEVDNAWVVSYNGNVQPFADGETAFDYLQGLRRHPSVPVGHRPYLKNLTRRLYEHLGARKAVA